MARRMRAAQFSAPVLASIAAFVFAGLAAGPRLAALSYRSGTVAEVISAAKATRGLIVHLDCDDGRLTAALHARGSSIVQGLDTDPQDLSKARAYIQRRGIYGPVSIARLEGDRLPYADNVVNLLVADNLGDIGLDEVTRVLAPGASAYIKRGGRWSRIVKPWPKGVDEWTHYAHDSSGNPVANDRLVGPPRHLQWTEDPRHTRSHEHTPSIMAVVSSAGRVFYIADAGPTSAVQRPPRWSLVARDAFNGILLWKRPIDTWYPHLLNWGATPLTLQRRLVAVGNRLYVTLGYFAPLSALDAATGATVKTYAGTDGTEEIVWHNGILLLVLRRVTDERKARLAELADLALQKNSPLYKRESAQPLLKQFRQTESKAPITLLAIDADTGKTLWRKQGEQTAGLRHLTLCADGDRVFFQRKGEVVCLDLRTGEQTWSVATWALRAVSDGKVICAGKKAITALNAADGSVLWKAEPALVSILDVFVINGSVWIGGFGPAPPKKRGPSWGAYLLVQRDLNSGRILRQIKPENPGHHHRCYRNKATVRYILGGRRGTEFIDLQSGEVLWNSWARGVCRYGVMPAYGLLYVPPHACACYIAAKLTGFNALATGKPGPIPAEALNPTPERGPAYSSPPSPSPTPDDWPTYRHDSARTGSTSSPVSPRLRQLWQVRLGGRLTSITLAAGKVLVSRVNQHEVCAFSADSGRELWRFTAGGRVDSPPTIFKGRAIFGCRDGYVYSVRLADGQLAWRLRAAPEPRQVVSSGQLESVWPVHGSVLISDGVAYVLAGRSSYLDGGMALYAIQPLTGKVLSRNVIYSPDPKTGKQPKQYGPWGIPGSRADILTADADHIYLRDMVFDRQGRQVEEGGPHLFALTDFLEDCWPHRSYWILGTRCSIACGCSGRAKDLIYARLLVFDDSTVYGYGRSNVHWSNQLRDGEYRVFAGQREDRKLLWQRRVPLHVRAMVRAGDVLFLAGAPAGPEGEQWFPELDRRGALIALSASDGSELARFELPAAPILDGMAAAAGRLYISLNDGRLICLGG